MKSAVILIALCLTVVDAVHTQHGPSSRRRRRAPKAPAPGNCGLVTKLMAEMVDLRAELKAMKKGAEKVKEMAEEIDSLKKEVEALKKSNPFQVEEGSKTVKLVGWNLHILADETYRAGDPSRWKCDGNCGKGNLIVGKGHKYGEAAESFFSGHGHSAKGYAHGFLGGVENAAGVSGSKYYGFAASALAGGFRNKASGRNDFIGGGRSGRAGSRGFSSVVVGGWRNSVNSSYSAVVGGEDNVANVSKSSLVLGGEDNVAQGSESVVIVGGRYNVITTDSHGSVINGGYNNTMKGSGFIVGGIDNRIDSPVGFQNGIVGGLGNLMAGWYLGKGNLVLGGEKNNASFYIHNQSMPTWKFQIVPITWKSGAAAL